MFSATCPSKNHFGGVGSIGSVKPKLTRKSAPHQKKTKTKKNGKI